MPGIYIFLLKWFQRVAGGVGQRFLEHKRLKVQRTMEENLPVLPGFSGKSTRSRQFHFERLEQRIVLSAQSWDLAADFAADFSGGLPQNNPNDIWGYYGSDGSYASLLKTNGNSAAPGPDTFGVGAGWAGAGGLPSYARGGSWGLPTNSIAGHGPNLIAWFAGPDVDMGAVKITGFLTQATFEPERQMRLQVFKNADTDPVIDISADFADQDNIIEIPPTTVRMQLLDQLRIVVDGTGEEGNGIETFAAYNVHIEEYALPGDYNDDFVVDGADYTRWQSTFDQTVTVGTGADGNGNGRIDAADYTVWQEHLGEVVLDGPPPAPFTPSAIVVETSGVTLPDGSQLDISTSQTQGLQEAFDLSAEQGWSIFVLPGTYTLDAHLDIEEIQLRTFRFQDVTMNFSSSVTDFGIRFDSTMLTDWYWDGGAINAPQAAHGVLFHPRTPHPLDGPKYGTKGVVDSRFHFNADIEAKNSKVTMNSQQATINDLSLHFRNVPRNQIFYTGSGFAAYNIFPGARTDPAIGFDPFSTAGRVTVNPPDANLSTGIPATVYLPNGTTLPITGTTTYGLQEAFDYAAANNLDVIVHGRGVRNTSPTTNFGLYQINSDLQVSDLTNRTYNIYAVTFNDSRSGGTTLSLGDMNNSTFELTGQLVSTGAANSLVIRPDDTGVHNSTVRIGAAVGSNAVSNTGVRIDPSLKDIQDNLFVLHEVNTGYFGIKVVNPSASTTFSDNTIRSLHTHATAHIGMQLGESSQNAQRIHSNQVEIRANTDGQIREAAMQVWGSSNALDLYCSNYIFRYSIKFEPGSANNVLTNSGIYACPLLTRGPTTCWLDLQVDLLWDPLPRLETYRCYPIAKRMTRTRLHR